MHYLRDNKGLKITARTLIARQVTASPAPEENLDRYPNVVAMGKKWYVLRFAQGTEETKVALVYWSNVPSLWAQASSMSELDEIAQYCPGQPKGKKIDPTIVADHGKGTA